jgi:tRNA modification GTPase
MQTIFATATAPLKSGVAIIRISGQGAQSALQALATGNSQLSAPIKPRTASLRKLYNPQTADEIDEALVLWFPGPASFTGEDVAELHVHGSRAVITEILEILSQMPDLRLAEPGEFSRRAYDNGKMDLTEAEGLADLIDAETKAQARQALRQKQGILKNLYDSWRKQLISMLANIEAYIDFPDEDIPDDVIEKVENSISGMQSSIINHLNDNRRGEKLRHGLQAVIIGAPNAGKSSLLNYLAKRDAAIVSNIAGTTRDVIEVHMDLNGYPIVFADTAGLRETSEAIESEGIKRAIDRAANADIKIALFDASTFPDVDNHTLELIDSDTIIVINKADLMTGKIPEKLAKLSPITISVSTQEGINKLVEKLEKLAEQHLSISSDPVITRERHRQLLQETLSHLNNFDLNEELELASENLRRAAVSLGKITGHIDVEEILDDIFSNFCIGK